MSCRCSSKELSTELGPVGGDVQRDSGHRGAPPAIVLLVRKLQAQKKVGGDEPDAGKDNQEESNLRQSLRGIGGEGEHSAA